MMTPQALFVGAVATSLLVGLTSPMLSVLWHLHPVWMPEVLPSTRESVFYGASLIVSTGALLLSAIPAAIAERLGWPLEKAMWLWFATAALLLLWGIA
jgi:hypothetical protein